jgi:hypothetical protein
MRTSLKLLSEATRFRSPSESEITYHCLHIKTEMFHKPADYCRIISAKYENIICGTIKSSNVTFLPAGIKYII